MNDINKELSAILDLHKAGTLETLDAVTRILDLHIGAAQPEFSDIMRGSAGFADADDSCNLKQAPRGAAARG